MLLRRITKHVTDQNWLAVFIDFIIVIFGVVIGIQVANWNEARQDKQAEIMILDRLIAEYTTNRELITEEKANSNKVLSATNKLLAMIAPEPDASISDETFAPIFLDCLYNPDYNPNLGVTNSLLASGDLKLINDTEIHRMLSQWQADLQVLTKWNDIERMHGEELIYGMVIDSVSVANLAQYFERNSTNKTSQLSSDYQSLLSSKRFEGLLANRRFNTLSGLRRLNELDDATKQLIERMKSRKKELI